MARRSRSRSRPSWGAAVLIELLAVLAIGALAMSRPSSPTATAPRQEELGRPVGSAAIQAGQHLTPSASRNVVWTDRQIEEKLQHAGQTLRHVTGEALQSHWRNLTR